MKLVLTAQARASYPSVTRWFITCVNQPQFAAVLGDVPLATTELLASGNASGASAAPAAAPAAAAPTKAPKAEKAKKEEKPKAAEKPKAKEPKRELMPFFLTATGVVSYFCRYASCSRGGGRWWR